MRDGKAKIVPFAGRNLKKAEIKSSLYFDWRIIKHNDMSYRAKLYQMIFGLSNQNFQSVFGGFPRAAAPRKPLPLARRKRPRGAISRRAGELFGRENAGAPLSFVARTPMDEAPRAFELFPAKNRRVFQAARKTRRSATALSVRADVFHRHERAAVVLRSCSASVGSVSVKTFLRRE